MSVRDDYGWDYGLPSNRAPYAAPQPNSTVSHTVATYKPETIEDPDYKFAEGRYIDELKKYIDSTYSQHYAVGKLQATEFIIDMGDGLGFTRGNVIKYAKRYGQKAGYNRADLMKVLHYALMMLYVHDNHPQNKEENA